MSTRSTTVDGRKVTPTVRKGQFYPSVEKITIDGKAVEFIGQSSRRIYHFTDDTVIKVEINGDQNEHEVQMYDTIRDEYPTLLPFVAKVWGYAEMETAHGLVSFLLQERLSDRSPDESDWEGVNSLASDLLFGPDNATDAYPQALGDDCRSQWKWTLDGQAIKCHDFAYWLDY